MKQKDLMWIQDHMCPKCANRKPRKPGDCSIYQSVFIDKTPIALANVDKLFKKNSCPAFTVPQNTV